MKNELVSIEFIRLFQEKFDSEQQYTEDELIKCYAISDEKFIACDNTDGNCYIESFDTLDQCLRYLNTNETGEDIKNAIHIRRNIEFITSLQEKFDSEPYDIDAHNKKIEYQIEQLKKRML